MSCFDNIWRNKTIFPDNMKIHTQEEKWERVKAHNLIFEFDTTEERIEIDNTKKFVRRDILEEGDKIITNAQNLVELINNSLPSSIVNVSEWWFSGGGLYFITPHQLNSISLNNISRVPEGTTRHHYFNLKLAKWNKYERSIVEKLIKDNKIHYLKLDDNKQFIRYYIKSPYSLHNKFDRSVLPLTTFFGNNDNIDLIGSNWRKYIDPKNINKQFIEKYKSKIFNTY